MKKAWVNNGVVRDICHADPFLVYHPEIAQLYSADVPDDCLNGYIFIDGEYQPPQVEPAVVVEVPAPTPAIPSQISMKQARLALLKAGMYTAAQDAIANMAGLAGQEARIVWEYSLTVDRNSQLVTSVSTALGLDATRVDELFILAETL